MLIHGASGGVGTALLQLGRLAGLQMYGTCSARGASTVSEMGAVPIDYKQQDFVTEIQRLTTDGVDVVFDPIGGAHLWHSRKALCRGGRVVGYGNTTTLRGEDSVQADRVGVIAFTEFLRSRCISPALASPGPETDHSLQHPDTQTAETEDVSRGFGHAA